MNAEKYTQKALEAVKTAQSMAQENGNQYLTTEHLLYALLDQDGGLIGSLFGKMGVDCDGLLSELDTLIRKLPRISGGSGEVYASPEVGKILNLAEKTAEKLHDEYLSVEHLMLAIFSEGSQSVRQLLSDHGITRSRFSDELAKVKTSPVTSDNPEDSYDALKKYGTDLVERARTKELDPVIGRDTVVWPQTHLIGHVTVGEECQLGPNSRLTDTTVGSGCTIDETIAIEAVIENGVDCGPRAYLRPGTHMLDGSKAGTHVEIKKSTIGEGSKVPHLSYIGDTTMGSGVNVGAGSITCNYDGVHKHKTVIGKDAFIGSDTMMVAPAQIGDGALVAAGSVITEPVPADALGLGRARQVNIEGWAADYRRRLHEDDEA